MQIFSELQPAFLSLFTSVDGAALAICISLSMSLQHESALWKPQILQYCKKSIHANSPAISTAWFHVVYIRICVEENLANVQKNVLDPVLEPTMNPMLITRESGA